MRLSFQDKAYLKIESDTTPMHIAGFVVFNYDDKIPRTEVIPKLIENLKKIVVRNEPFNLVLSTSNTKLNSATWKKTDAINFERHIKRYQLINPGDREEFLSLFSQIARPKMNLQIPLWEISFIDGYGKNQFVSVLKVHHSLVDGLKSVQFAEVILTAMTNNQHEVIWNLTLGNSKKREIEKLVWLTIFKKYSKTILETSKIYLNAVIQSRSDLPLWYQAKPSALNGPITAERSYAFIKLDLNEFARIAKKHNATVNDLFLTICAGGIRAYFKNKGITWEASIKASVPCKIESQQGFGNSFTLLILDIAVQMADPLERLKVITNRMQILKQKHAQLPRRVLLNINKLCYWPFFMSQVHNLGDKISLPFNLSIANVKGFANVLGCEGATMKEQYGFSCLYKRLGLSIVATSYNERLHLGLMACPSIVTNVDLLADGLMDEYNTFKDLSNLSSTPFPSSSA